MSRGRADHLSFLGEDTRKVLEDAPCAIAVTPTGYADRAGSFHKIGVGFNGSTASERAVAIARRLAAAA